jgi:hypothetical protein
MESSKSGRNKIIIALIIIIVLALLVWFFIWITANGYWPVVRDIALVALALLSFIPILALTYAIFQVGRTAAALRRELVPAVSDLRETSRTIRDTSKAASKLAVKPTVRTAGFIYGFTQSLRIILGQSKGHKDREARQKRSQAAANNAEQEPTETAPIGGENYEPIEH